MRFTMDVAPRLSAVSNSAGARNPRVRSGGTRVRLKPRRRMAFAIRISLPRVVSVWRISHTSAVVRYAGRAAGSFWSIQVSTVSAIASLPMRCSVWVSALACSCSVSHHSVPLFSSATASPQI